MPYNMNNQLNNQASVVIGASATDTQISEIVKLSDEDSMTFNVDITAASGTYAAGITAKLQDRASGSESWNDNKTAAITADGLTTITLQANVSGDQSSLPLRPQVRVVVSTGSGDAVTITKVRISSRRSR